MAASINGVTLFPAVDAGIAEMVRVTKPGGRVVLVCFAHGIEHAEFVTFLFAAVRTAVPDAVLPRLTRHRCRSSSLIRENCGPS